MRQKSTAILLAFFIGSFGIHKFYLGQNLQGIIYLLLSTTIIFWFIPAILSMIDLVIYVLMDDNTFNSQYN